MNELVQINKNQILHNFLIHIKTAQKIIRIINKVLNYNQMNKDNHNHNHNVKE